MTAMANKENQVVYHILARQHGLGRVTASSNFHSHLFKSRLSLARNLYQKNLISHFGCINALEFSKDGKFLTSGGDDRRVLLWNLEKSIFEEEKPVVMLKQHLSNIFTLGFDSKSTRLFSGGNDDNVIVHDILTGDCLDVIHHTKPVYCLSLDPNNDNIFATAGDDGRILLFDLRASNDDPSVVARYRAPFHSVMFHPVESNFLITANAKEGAALWDIRARLPVIRYGGDDAAQSCMSVRFNSSGNLLIALRRRLPPVLYSTIDQDPICQFYHQDYYNSCTMKSCTFAGAFDELVLSGSDDFNLYAWSLKNDVDFELRNQWVGTHQMVLYGHRSIVNQIRWNEQKCLFASAGVEKIIKLWSPFQLEEWTGSLTEEIQSEPVREVFTHDEYISLNMTHDYSNQNTSEDHRMIAFFDYLVQQEFEEWSSESSNQNSDHTSENSSRPDSPTSDTEPTHFTTVKLPRHHRESHRRSEPSYQRNKYRNRIAYLIATKRKTLKRLALKKVTRYSSRRLKNKFVPRQSKRAAATRAMGRKPYDKKMRRLSVQTKYKKPVSHEQTSDSEVPQRKKRRTQSYTATSSYRSFRKKAATPLSSASNTSNRVADKSADSSSDYDDRLDDNKIETSVPVLDVNVPSTSTGITANGKGFMFRISNFANDSDESIPDSTLSNSDNNRLMRILKSSPLHNFNNNHKNYFPNDVITGGAGTSAQCTSFISSAFRQENHQVAQSNGRYTQEDDSFVEDSTNSNSPMSSPDDGDSSKSGSCSKRRRVGSNEKAPEGNVAETSNVAITSTPTSNPSIVLRTGPSSPKLEIMKRNYRQNIQTSDDESD